MGIDLYAELRQVIQALNKAGVPYAVVGAVAVSLYARPRATQDIDLLIPEDSWESVRPIMADLGYTLLAFPMTVGAGRIRIHRVTRLEGGDLLSVDFLVPLDPDLLWLLRDRVRARTEGIDLWVIGLRGLRTLKRLRGSAQDLADLEALGLEEGEAADGGPAD
jgi:hypothetical protein